MCLSFSFYQSLVLIKCSVLPGSTLDIVVTVLLIALSLLSQPGERTVLWEQNGADQRTQEFQEPGARAGAYGGFHRQPGPSVWARGSLTRRLQKMLAVQLISGESPTAFPFGACLTFQTKIK